MEKEKLFITVKNEKVQKAKMKNGEPIEPSLVFACTSELTNVDELNLIIDGVEDMVSYKEDYKGIFYKIKANEQGAMPNTRKG